MLASQCSNNFASNGWYICTMSARQSHPARQIHDLQLHVKDLHVSPTIMTDPSPAWLARFARFPFYPRGSVTPRGHGPLEVMAQFSRRLFACLTPLLSRCLAAVNPLAWHPLALWNLLRFMMVNTLALYPLALGTSCV